jgi:hypothetical protein
MSSSGATAPPAAADAAPPSWKTWHSDTDIADRRNLIHEMCVAGGAAGAQTPQTLLRCPVAPRKAPLPHAGGG